MINRVKVLSLSVLLVTLLWGIFPVMAAVPYGANYTYIDNERFAGGTPQNISAHAGNLTEVDIVGWSTTQTWQGYFGNISGTIQLADVNQNVMYNWSLASPEGEVFAANHSTVSWTSISCFNHTATGAYTAESENYGNVSKLGMNMSQLETAYNIKWDDVDGVNETFLMNNHPEFFVANYNFSAGECKNTQMFSSAKKSEGGKFEEVLLYDNVRLVPIFTTILDENVAGFDQEFHDFEMIVLDDGHGTNTAPTTYYFYIEIE